MMRMRIGSFIGAVVILAAIVLHSVNPWAHAAAMARTDGPPGNLSAWTLAYSDDFTASVLNTQSWSTCYWWAVGANGCAAPNGELERYLPQNVSVHDGTLDLQALHQQYALNGKTYPYTSGMVSSAGKYGFLYGYMEARVKVPSGQGYWPAFWSLAADHTPPTELDTMELLGNDPHTIYVGAHYADSQKVHHHQGTPLTGPDFSTDFHTVGVDWAADHLTFYVDGVSKYSITNAAVIPQRALYLILNLAVGGTWPGAPDATTTFPGHYLVDWVRVWQHTGTQPLPTTIPTPGAPNATPTVPPATTVPSPTANSSPTPTSVPRPPATPTPVVSGTPSP
ncbi:MAG: family 16 glycosylhydrolase, partial [Ktedonobacterales bacterium]|nr:family 16 glycosylhydrolase [Ktedonobacterales bacterium]